MRYILYISLCFTITVSTSAKEYANKDFKNLMTRYLSALQQKDEKALSQITSKRFLKKFKKSGQLQQVFDAQKNNKIDKFDLSYKKARNKKDLYMVNIKNPDDKEYDEYWYFIKSKNGKLVLDEMHNLK